MTTLTEVFPCFFLSCKANAKVKPAKTVRTLPNFCVVLCIVCFVSFCVFFVCVCVLYCTVLYAPGNLISGALKNYIL